MPEHTATIESLGQAFEMVKVMQGDGLGWGEDYRPLARQALVEIIEGRMAEAVDAGWTVSASTTSPTLGSSPRAATAITDGHLLTQRGDIELAGRTPKEVVRT